MYSFILKNKKIITRNNKVKNMISFDFFLLNERKLQKLNDFNWMQIDFPVVAILDHTEVHTHNANHLLKKIN